MEANNLSLRQLKEEKAKRLLFDAYRADPLFWLEHRLGEKASSFEWSQISGYEKHTWDGDIDPLANAWRDVAKVYTDIKAGKTPEFKNVAVEAATGTSKTYWLARLCLWFLDCFDNSLIVTSAPKQDQLKLGLWSEISMAMNKFKKVRPESMMYKLRLAVDDRGGKDLDEDDMIKSQSWHCIGFVAGVGAEEQSANKARGFHRKHMLIILEECTGMPMPVLAAFQNTCTGDHNIIVAVGNPDNEFDPLHVLTQQKNVKSYRISAFDYPNIVTHKELFSGAVTWSSINSRKDVYGEGSPLYQAMVRGISPSQSSDSLIKLEWIEQCVNLQLENDIGYNALGIDVANSESGDKAAMAFGRRSALMELLDFQCKNATHLAYNALFTSSELRARGYEDYHTPTMEDYGVHADCVGVDAVGVGVATVNAFTDNGYAIHALQGGQWEEALPLDETTKRPLYRFSTLRAQMYWQLREDLRQSKISIQLTDHTVLLRLKKELVIPKFDTRQATVAVEKKEDIKKRMGGQSPNLADAVVYWNWMRNGFRIDRYAFMPISAGR